MRVLLFPETLVLANAMTLVVFPALMAFAACSDLLTMTISNRIALALVAGFFVLALMTGMPWTVIGWHAGAGAAVLVAAFLCFSRGWIGGGDAKLAAATALWFGFDQLAVYLVWASLFGGVLTLLLLRFRQMALPAPLARQEWLLRLHGKNTGIPYGIALAAAALLVYSDSPFMHAMAF
jgi:prepilin peptidase CpaA